jgi:hypothetical protein
VTTVGKCPSDAPHRPCTASEYAAAKSRASARSRSAGMPVMAYHGNVALPQGWGHRGGWQRAIADGGVSYNELTPNQSEDLNPFSGQAWLNGFPVRVEAPGTDTRKTDPVNAPNN